MVFKRKTIRLSEEIKITSSNLNISEVLKMNISDKNFNSTSQFTSQSGTKSIKKSTQQDAKCLLLLMELNGIEPSTS